MLPRDLRVSRPANQRPVAPRLLLLTLHFCRPPPPAPRAAAKRRVVSRRFRFAHVSHPLVARPLLPAVQYSISTQARQPFWKLSLSLCFLFFHSLRRVSINCRHIHPVHSLSRSGPRRRLQGCRPAPFTVRYISDQAHPASSPLSRRLAQLAPYFSLCPLVNSRKASPG